VCAMARASRVTFKLSPSSRGKGLSPSNGYITRPWFCPPAGEAGAAGLFSRFKQRQTDIKESTYLIADSFRRINYASVGRCLPWARFFIVVRFGWPLTDKPQADLREISDLSS